jgi:hypothetical protein
MLPVKRIDGSLVMCHEHAARAVVELMEIGKTPSGADPVLQHAPEAFNRVEVVTAVGRQEMEAKLAVVVVEGGVELVRSMDPAPVDHHHNFFRSFAEGCHDLMNILAQFLGIKVGHNFIKDFRGAILDRPNDTQQDAAGDPVPGAILHPCLAFEGFLAFDLTLAQRTRREAGALHFAPPTRPGQGKTPEDRFIFIEQNDLTPAGPVLEGREFKRRPRQLSGVRSEPARGAAVADVFFLTRRGRSHG